MASYAEGVVIIAFHVGFMFLSESPCGERLGTEDRKPMQEQGLTKSVIRDGCDLFIFVALGIEPRALPMLGKHSLLNYILAHVFFYLIILF